MRAGAIALVLAGGALLGLSPDAAGPGPRPARADERPAPAAPRNVLQEIEEAVQGIGARLAPSVVEVVVERMVALTPLAEPQREVVVMSGTVWDAEGHIVSLGRVFETARSVEVVSPQGERCAADVVDVDEATGLALLKVEPGAIRLVPAPLGRSAALKPGSLVVQVSNPFGLTGSVSLGTVSGVARVVKRGPQAVTGVLQVTTPVNPGDPGGALADSSGRVVGIVASSYERGLDAEHLLGIYERLLRVGGELVRKSSGEPTEPEDDPRFSGGRAPFGGQSVGFAVPVDQARVIVERLKRQQRAERGWLGLQVLALDPVLKAQLDLPVDRGILVVGVVADGPASHAGLERHDVLLRYAGAEVHDLGAFKDRVEETIPGRAVELEVLRKGERKTLTVTPTRRPR